MPGPGETDTYNAGFNYFFGDQPGFTITREVVTEGDFPGTVDGFRRASDVMTYGNESITPESLDALRRAALALQPNIVIDRGRTFFDPQVDIGVVVAAGSTDTNPAMTATGNGVLPAQLDGRFRPTVNNAVEPTDSARGVAALRREIETRSGSCAADSPVQAPVAPEITALSVNEQVLGANDLVAVHGGTFTLEWQNKDALTSRYEFQVDRGDGEWSPLASVPRGPRATRFVTQSIDQFAHVKEGEPAWVSVSNGPLFKFRVRATNAAGASAWSAVHRYDTVAEATASATVTRLQGHRNELTISVTETYLDGTSDVRRQTFLIPNNAADTYRVGSNLVFVDTKGNSQVRRVELTRD